MNCNCDNCKDMNCVCVTGGGCECTAGKCDAVCPQCQGHCMEADGSCCCGKPATKNV